MIVITSGNINAQSKIKILSTPALQALANLFTDEERSKRYAEEKHLRKLKIRTTKKTMIGVQYSK